jgi:branched-chain amino acid aminotransferase
MKEKEFYVSLCGNLIPANQPIFNFNNRAFRYGDGLFETIRLVNGNLHLFNMHLERLLNGMQFLKMKSPRNWKETFFKEAIFKLLEKNNHLQNARIRINVFRGDGGYYTPLDNKPSFLIESDPFPSDNFPLNEEGLKIDIFPFMEKPTSLASNFKTCNALIYVMAAIFRNEKELDDCLIINSKNRAIEAISSNLYIVKDGEIHMPPLTEGCVAGVMRLHLLNLMQENEIKYIETPVALEDLFAADELFLSDSVSGIRWVKQYKSHEYKLNIAEKLSKLLNESLKT